MSEITATATEIQKNFRKYITMVIKGNDVIITKNGKEVARVIPSKQTSISDSMVGLVKGDYGDYKTARNKAFQESQE